MGHSMATKASVSSKATTTAAKSSGPKPARAPAKPVSGAAPAPAPKVVTETPAVVDGEELKKKELIDEVVARSGVRKKFAKPAIEAMIDILGEAISDGREVNLQPLGKIKLQRTKDTSNARITVVKIRQSKSAGPALDPEDRADLDNSKETVADRVE